MAPAVPATMAAQDDAPRTSGVGRVEASPGETDAAAAPTSTGGVSSAAAEEPHDVRLVVWDTPPAMERGKRFAVKLGLTCPAGCRPGGWTVEVRNQDGETQAAATIGDEPWPGTDALFHAEVGLVAPDAEGLHTWEAAALTEGRTGAHTGCRTPFSVRVVSAPACALTVFATDAQSGSPVEGARVVAHPYRTVTDERGMATLRVPAGEYRLFVSGKGYAPFRFDGEVQADTTIRAVLAQDVELSDADIWS